MLPSAHKLITPLIVAIVVLIPLAYSPVIQDAAFGPKLLILQVLIALCLGVWLFDRAVCIPRLAVPALLFILIGFASAFYATDPNLSLLASTRYLAGFLLFFILANHLTPSSIPIVFTASIWTGIFVALLGIGDYFDLRPLNIPSSGLPSATFGFRNIAAMYLIQLLPLTVAMFVLARARYAYYLNALAVALMGAFLLYTRTRGAWLGLCIATITVYLFWQTTAQQNPQTAFKSKKWPAIIAFSIFVILSVLPSNLSKRGPQSLDEKKTTITTTLTSALSKGGDRGRLSTWRNTLPMLADHPLQGVGLGNWQIQYPRYDQGTTITFNAAPERPHNEFLQILSETGIVGLGVYLWFCIAVIRTGYHTLKTPNLQTRWIAAACLTSFIAILVHSFFSFPSERVTPTVFFWLASGILAALSGNGKRLSSTPATAILVVAFIISLVQIAFAWRIVQFNAHIHRAAQAEQNADWERVANETEQALVSGAFHREALHLRGYALNVLGRLTDAQHHYEEAQKHHPYDIQILSGHAIALQNQGKFTAAESLYRRALDLIDSPDIRYNLAGLYLQSGRAKDAIAQYNRVLLTEEPSLDLYYHLIHAYLFAKEPDGAAKIMVQTIATTPRIADHIQHIEGLYQRHRKQAIIRTCYKLLIAHWTENPDHLIPVQKRLKQLESASP